MDGKMGRQRRYTTEEYEEAISLLERGLGLSKVSKITGIPKSTLYYWRNWIYKPPSTRWMPKPINSLAYVIGVLMGDANLARHGYKYDIELKTMDKPFAETFAKHLSKTLEKPIKKPTWTGPRRGWRAYQSSKAFHQWYQKQTLQTLKPYIEHDKDTVKHFLQGLYDSDGSNDRNAAIALANSNIDLLVYVQYLLKRYFNIDARGPYLTHKKGSIMKIRGKEFIRKKDCFRIVIYKKLHVKKFLTEVGFTIPRKQQGRPKRKMTYHISNLHNNYIENMNERRRSDSNRGPPG